MKIKILRVPYFSPWEDSHRLGTSLIPPLGMAEMTSYFRKKGFDVEQDDLNIKFHKLGLAKKLNPKGVSKSAISKVVNNLIKSTHFDMDLDAILLSVYTSRFGINDFLVKEIVNILKHNFNCKLIIGGNRFFNAETFFPLLKDQTVDFVIKGNCQLAETALLKKKSELKSMEGIAFEDKGFLFFKKPTSDIRQIEIPDFFGLPTELYKWNPDKNFKHHLLKGVNKNPNILVLPMSFMSGCNNACAFCSFPSSQRPYTLEPKKTVDIIEFLHKKYSTPFFMFLNNMFNFSREYAQELCEEIIARDFKILWGDSVSSKDLDNKTLKLMKNAGCIRLYFGLETASQRLLGYIDKKISLPGFSNVIKYASNLGIWNGVELIPGLPYENEEDISQTIDFINKHKEYIDELTVSPFYMLEQSRFYKEPKKFGLRIIDYKINTNNTGGYSYPMRVAFDEINGLEWSEKKKQIDHSYLRIISEINIPFELWDERFFFLCWLYSEGYDKQDIKRIYKSIHPRLLRKQYMNLPTIFKKMYGLRSLSDLKRGINLFKKFI